MQLKQPNTRTWMTVKVMTKMVSQTAMGMTDGARCGAGKGGQGRQGTGSSSVTLGEKAQSGWAGSERTRRSSD